MAADEEVTSLTGVDSYTRNRTATFATTHWSVVLTAQGKSSEANEALEKICRTYWRPLYAFVRQYGYRHEEAEDLTQGFFAVLLERRDFDTLRAEKGRLRSYLLVALKHFLADERRRAIGDQEREKGNHSSRWTSYALAPGPISDHRIH